MGNWLSRTIHPQAETQEPKPGSDEKQEDVKSSPTVKSADSGVSSAKDAKLTTAKGSTSKTSTDAKAPETLQPKVPSSSQKQVTLNITEDNPSKISKPKATDSKVSQPKATDSKVSQPKATDSKVSQPKATDSKVSQPKAADSKVSQPKAAEVLPAAVPSSSQKQDLPSKVPVTETPANEVSKDSTGAGGTATVPMPDEDKKGLTKPTLFRSSLNRFWTSMQNFRESLSGRKSSSIPADHLNRVESETGLSNDLRVESNMFLNQNKLDHILGGYKKKLSVLFVFPKPGKQHKVFCDAIQKTNFSQPSHATDSKSAITYCKDFLFDLILIDCTNKELLDAKDLCRKLRVHNPRTVIVAVRQRTYFQWPWTSNSEELSGLTAAGFTRDFVENHSITACQDALTCFEKDVDVMIQLRFLKGLYSAVENVQEIIEVSSAHHELQYVNKAFERLLGYTMGEVMGKPWFELMMSDRNPTDLTMKIKHQLDSSNPWEGHNYIKKKSGELLANTCHIIPLIEAGKVLQFIGIRKVMDQKLPETKLVVDSPSGSTQSGWPSPGLADVHSATRGISSIGMRDRGMSITAPQSPHSFFSNQNLVNEVTTALASIKAIPCPATVYQIIDRVTEIIKGGDKLAKATAIFKEDDELVTELLDGLMTASIPTNVEEDMRGRRRSTYYPASKSIARLTTRHSETGSITISALPLALGVQSSAGEIRKVLDNVFNWNFDVLRLEDLTSKRPLLYVGLKIFQAFEVYSFLSTDAATFKNWLDVIEHHYNAYNPYHNSTHAADVLQAAASLCRREKLAEIYDDMDITSTLIAAAIHDLDHPGKTNSFLINSHHKLAILYNDVSVLENHHTALAFRLTFKDSTCNIFQKVEKDDYRILRQQIIDMVLATDMTKHFDYLGRFNDTIRRTSIEAVPANLGARVFPVEFRTVVKRMLIKCCDVSNPTRPIDSCKVWAQRIAEEYCRQTDEEKCRGLQVVMPVFDRSKLNLPKTQLSFMNLFILNMMESWNEFCPVPDLMRNLEINFDYWQQMEPTTKEKVVRVVTN